LNTKEKKSRMRLALTALLLGLAVGGLYFLGTSVTGHVTSQTCCLPPNCAQAYLCSAAGYTARTHEATVDARHGVLLVFGAAMVFIVHELREHE
jgi:hypothetical protein